MKLTRNEIESMINDYKSSRKQTKDKNLYKICTDRIKQLEEELKNRDEETSLEDGH